MSDNTNIEQIKIGMVEDQLLFREGLKAILSEWPEIEVVFESPDGFSVLDRLKSSNIIPDIMLVDLSLPATPFGKEFNGLEVTKALLRDYPTMKIMILSLHEDESFIAKLIEEGAHSYLVKDSNPAEVYEAIKSLYIRGSYINERTLKAMQNNRGKKNNSFKIAHEITKREEDILQLICQQLTDEEIAEKLFLSVRTVNGHRNNLLQKTGSKNVTGLVIYAVKNHIVELL